MVTAKILINVKLVRQLAQLVTEVAIIIVYHAVEIYIFIKANA